MKKVMFSPVTRLSGLLSVEVVLGGDVVVEANAGGTLFRGFEWIMRGRPVTDAVYMTQRICGICSQAHGAVASYLVDELYDAEIPENAQYIRNVMLAADFLQNHIRHFYVYSLPDWVRFPEVPPFLAQNTADLRFGRAETGRLLEHYVAGLRAAQQAHQLLAIFGGKAPHQHSFVHGGVSVRPDASKVSQAQALADDIQRFVETAMWPDTELLAETYSDYYAIGVTPANLLSYGLWRFGARNEEYTWRGGVLADGSLTPPVLELITETGAGSWFEEGPHGEPGEPAPFKPGAYSWVKTVLYDGRPMEVGPLARMLINGYYSGGTSTMDRVVARSLETKLICSLLRDWLACIRPGPPPIDRRPGPVRSRARAVADSMRGALLHSAALSGEGEMLASYDIITPSAWNFSPKSPGTGRGPAEAALVGTVIEEPDRLFTTLGRTIRSFDPCLSCGTHVLDTRGRTRGRAVL